MAEKAIISSTTGFVQNQTPAVGSSNNNPPAAKRKRNLPGTPDPEAEVIALSPKTLMATNRFLCEICGKGFQRDQNLQLHRRGHNLPWKLKQRTSKEPRKRVYVCPEKSCVHNHPSRALGDLTGIKKHFCRKHGEKKWKCDKCSKRYAVQSDWKAHSKTCGTREYKCDCGTLFSRRDSFITHRAFCDALAEETARLNAASYMSNSTAAGISNCHFLSSNMTRQQQPTLIPSVFRPISTNAETIISETTRGLSLWMGQGTGLEPVSVSTTTLQDQIHQLGPNIYADPLITNNPPLQSDYQLSWVFGNNKISSTNNNNNAHAENHQLTSSTSSLPLSDVKVGTHHQLISVPSLYSNQHHSNQTPASANMSATALLQKAAQIGVTSTDPSFLGNFGLKGCDNHDNGDGNKLCGLYGSNGTAAMSSSHGSSVENPESDALEMYPPPAKRRHVQNSEEGGAGGGQTRDFLGVGVQTICHPSSINGWI